METTDVTASPPITAPQSVYRPEDPRVPHDDAALAAVGIRAYESKRLKLYTDIDPELAQSLPTSVNPLFDALEAYFGPLPPARDGSDFQMTGYLLKEERVFREAGLIPLDLPPFNHGRHRANEFWLRDQEYDYYRRHLLMHEVTHCVMTYLPDTQTPVWYMEGMAEYFATHRIVDGRFQFGIMPASPEEVAGWGRITLIRQAFADNRAKNVADVFALQPVEYQDPEPYAWSWALCHFLATHPRYRNRFQQVGREARGPQFMPRLADAYTPDGRELATEWTLFVIHLQYGYDVERSAIDFRSGEPLTEPARTATVAADQGWQSSGIKLEKGKSYNVSATGRFTLADEPKPWVSEPQGISIRYADGHPLGLLLGCLRADDIALGETMLRVLPIGRERTFVAPVTGTLYLRLNDSWSELADNRGEATVAVSLAE
jgi:hypothetical protein